MISFQFQFNIAQPFQETMCEYKMSSFLCCLTVHNFQATEIKTLASIQMNCSCALNHSEYISVYNI